MGENEQGGMLRNVVVVGLVAMIALIVTLAVVGLKGNMLAGTSNATDSIQKEIKNANGNTVESVVDDYDTSSHYYTLDRTSKTAKIGTYQIDTKEKDKGAVVVPTYVTHMGIKYTVIEIGGSAYSGGSEITSVTIPDTIKTIDDHAFAGISKLTSVTFGSGLETIGNAAFQSTALSSVTVPDNVKTIGEQAFEYVPNNKDGFVSIGKDTAYNKDGWKSSFGSYWDSDAGRTIGYKPTIRN